MQRMQERFALTAQFLFELLRAIAFAAGPGLGPVFVTAIAPRMSILHG